MFLIGNQFQYHFERLPWQILFTHHMKTQGPFNLILWLPLDSNIIIILHLCCLYYRKTFQQATKKALYFSETCSVYLSFFFSNEMSCINLKSQIHNKKIMPSGAWTFFVRKSIFSTFLFLESTCIASSNTVEALTNYRICTDYRDPVTWKPTG